MSSPPSLQPILASTLLACALVFFNACSPESQAALTTATGNPITGEGLPNPAPMVTANWGKLPPGRMWGSSAGIEIDPIDGNIWAYERCGAGALQDDQINCDN